MPSLEDLSKRIEAIENYMGLKDPQEIKPVSQKEKQRLAKAYEVRKKIILRQKAK